LVVLVIAIFRWWERRKTILNLGRPLVEIARLARASRDDIYAGRDPGNAILECYQRMSEVVADRRGLHRQDSMTVTEFASRLERAGLPEEAVRGLTGLFEAVRYGAFRSTRAEVNRALACLEQIVTSCGEPA
jgi:hypothetical protein